MLPFRYLIALAAVTRGRRARGANALRMTIGSVAATGIRIAGYGVQGMAVSKPAFCVLFYLIPLLGAGAALAVLAGAFPKSVATEPNPAPEAPA